MSSYYEFTGETIRVGDATLHRIRAVTDLPRHGVRAGDVGGWIAGTANLFGGAWVSGDARVYGDAQVCVSQDRKSTRLNSSHIH